MGPFKGDRRQIVVARNIYIKSLLFIIRMSKICVIDLPRLVIRIRIVNNKLELDIKLSISVMVFDCRQRHGRVVMDITMISQSIVVV